MKKPDLKIERRAVAELVAYKLNARTHPDAQIDQIVASIKEFGFTNPILVDEKNVIIAGHGRLQGAVKAGMDEVPCIVLRGLTEAQKRAYRLADNKIALNGGWDRKMLLEEFDAIAGAFDDIGITGFTEGEISDIFMSGAAGKTDEDDAPPAPAKPKTKRGDVYVLGRHLVACGDATCSADLSRLMEGGQAHCVWTDPPYNVDYKGTAGKIQNDNQSADDYAAMIGAAFALMKFHLHDGAAVYVAHADTEGETMRREFREAGFHLSSCLIWRKNALVLGRADYHWQHEPILYGWKRGGGPHKWYGARGKKTIQEINQPDVIEVAPGRWQIGNGEESVFVSGKNITIETVRGTVFFEDKPKSSAEHPTMKPVALIERMLLNSTVRGDVVLDPFGGSGSTLIACEKHGRACRVIDLDPKFVDVIVSRWENFTGEKARKV